MARPRKTGLDYFPFDCGFFDDAKIASVAGEFGIKGEIVAIRLLCAIYREGYFMQWSEMQKMIMLRQLPGISAGLFDQILDRLLKWGFLDIGLFESAKVLTSSAIQRRYFEVTKRRLRKDEMKFLLINVTETQPVEIPQERVSVTLTPINATETPVNVTESTRNKSKYKESSDEDKKVAVVVDDYLEAVLEDFLSDRNKGLRERLAMKHHVEIDSITEIAKQLIDEWRFIERQHKSLDDARQHFKYALDIKLNKIKDENAKSRDVARPSQYGYAGIKNRIVPGHGLKSRHKTGGA